MYVQVAGYWVYTERSVRRMRPRYTGLALTAAVASGIMSGLAVAWLSL